MRACFYKSSLNTSDSGLEEAAFFNAGSCVSSGGLVSGEEASDFLRSTRSFKGLVASLLLCISKALMGRRFFADNKFVINTCFDKIDENHVKAWRKGSLSKKDFVKAVLCVIGGEAKNVQKNITLTKLELAKKVDATDYKVPRPKQKTSK